MKTQAIIPAAGIGTRFKTDEPKPFALLDGKPIFVRTCEVFEKIPSVESLLLVVNDSFRDRFEEEVSKASLTKVKKIVTGGATRSDSVFNGLMALDPDTKFVIIHDAARPNVTDVLINATLKTAQEFKAAITAVPMKPTVKRVNKETLFVEETLNRDELWEIQTPQVFEKDLLIQAHEKFRDSIVTDDAMLIERLNHQVKVVRGDYHNLKITTQEDLLVAQTLLKARL